MGFGDFLGEMAGRAVNKIQEDVEKNARYVEQYDRLDDERLISKFKSESDFNKKAAMAKVLKSRGYGNQD